MSPIRSAAGFSRSKPPSTDCSASSECGGTFSASIWVSLGIGGTFEQLHDFIRSPLAFQVDRRSSRQPSPRRVCEAFCQRKGAVTGPLASREALASGGVTGRVAQHGNRDLGGDIG